MSGEQFHFVFPQPVPSLESLFFGDDADTSIRILRSWRNWRKPILALTGPERSGVTTVLKSWVREVDGRYLVPAEWMLLDAGSLARLLSQPLALDDVDLVKPSSGLLTIINLSVEQNIPVLLGGHGNPQHWHREPPDLVSRLSAATQLVLPVLDETTFKRRLRAACLRRFIDLPQETLKYVSSRLDQSYQAVETFADQLNTAMGSASKPASIPVARQVLNEMYPEPGDNKNVSD